jgi:L-ascorbate metabolism protein UlaG (beta-lactamase superfamily)
MPATITWFGHATVRLTLPDDRVIFIDPWLTDNPVCPDNLKDPPRCDMLLLTHGHFDHVGDAPRLLEKFQPKVVGNFEVCTYFEKTVGKGTFSAMNTGGTQTVDGIKVSLTQAFHSSGIMTPEGNLAYGGMPNGVVVEVPGLASVYHASDTCPFMDMKLIKQLWDPKICILPIGDHFTMGPRGAAIAAELLEPKHIIPIHYKTFPILAQSADDFQAALPPNLKDRVVTVDVGQELAWTAGGIG